MSEPGEGQTLLGVGGMRKAPRGGAALPPSGGQRGKRRRPSQGAKPFFMFIQHQSVDISHGSHIVLILHHIPAL